tara:strand:- start:2939 stop:3706 length:768 start_codon:yes stop_codon:yes gene_type:complete
MVLTFDREAREIEVPVADGTTLEIQELYNDIRTFEALSASMDLRSLAVASGKQSLGGTSQVGITLQLLQTWLVGFEARGGPALLACVINGGNLTANHTDTGAATSSGTTTLVDTAAMFARHAAQPGDVLRNVTDGSAAVVIAVSADDTLTHTALTGGAGNDWDIADVWELDMAHPVYPTAFTHVTIAQDTAPLGVSLFADAALLRKIFLNRAETTVNAGPTPPAGSKTIDFYDDDQATIIDSIEISTDGNTRTQT